MKRRLLFSLPLFSSFPPSISTSPLFSSLRLTFHLSSLSPSSASSVPKVDYRTEDGTANAGSDYEFAEGTLVFKPGETLKGNKGNRPQCW